MRTYIGERPPLQKNCFFEPNSLKDTAYYRYKNIRGSA